MNARDHLRQLPIVLAATSCVLLLPLMVMVGLKSLGLVESALFLSLGGAVTSLAIFHGAERFWSSRSWSGDLLFQDLMIWGWIRRLFADWTVKDSLALIRSRPLNSAEAEQHIVALERLASALEARDTYTHRHSRRVARHSARIAKELGLPAAQISMIRTAAAVHDVGKIETPREILGKPGALTDEEFAEIKLHPVNGARMVGQMGDPEVTLAVRHHHERLDGKGYPSGLQGDEIPLGARIIAVADSFDAITSQRPYRAAKPHKVALDILRKEAGTQLDPKVVDAFLRIYSGRSFAAFWAALSAAPGRAIASIGSPGAGTGAAGVGAGTGAGAGAGAAVGAGSFAASAGAAGIIAAGAAGLGPPVLHDGDRPPAIVRHAESASHSSTPNGLVPAPETKGPSASANGTSSAPSQGTGQGGGKGAGGKGNDPKGSAGSGGKAEPKGEAGGGKPEQNPGGAAGGGSANPGSGGSTGGGNGTSTGTPASPGNSGQGGAGGSATPPSSSGTAGSGGNPSPSGGSASSGNPSAGGAPAPPPAAGGGSTAAPGGGPPPSSAAGGSGSPGGGAGGGKPK